MPNILIHSKKFCIFSKTNLDVLKKLLDMILGVLVKTKLCI
ncbi:unnamed protein product [Meloidogyne enterolobii]|uniref:Uncharacterized protein n=1 Tax=Meloidogyne enterolobii TaxID=390850 RepID=A0ACB0Z6I1_MELEN